MIFKSVIYHANRYHSVMIENRFAELLGIKRMYRRDVVRLTGINRQTVRNIYYNKTKGIDFETLNKLCFALDCTPNDLFRYIPD